MKISKITTIVALDVTGEERVLWGNKDHGKFYEFEPQVLEITYEWFPERGFWRAQQSTAAGFGTSASCRGELVSRTWAAQEHSKPLWVAALEHRFYPEPVKQKVEW